MADQILPALGAGVRQLLGEESMQVENRSFEGIEIRIVGRDGQVIEQFANSRHGVIEAIHFLCAREIQIGRIDGTETAPADPADPVRKDSA